MALHFICDRCHRDVGPGELYTTQLLFTEVAVNEEKDADLSEVKAVLCTVCTEALEDLLADFSRQPAPSHPRLQPITRLADEASTIQPPTAANERPTTAATEA